MKLTRRAERCANKSVYELQFPRSYDLGITSSTLFCFASPKKFRISAVLV